MRVYDVNRVQRRVSVNSDVGTEDDGDVGVHFSKSVDQAAYVSRKWHNQEGQEQEEEAYGEGDFKGMAVADDGQSATALAGRVSIVGFGAEEVAKSFELLYERSPTFQQMADIAFLQRWELLDVEIGTGQRSHASIGRPGAQYMFLNLSDAFGTRYGVTGLVAHEATHAFGRMFDGDDIGKAGDTQVAVARMMQEIGIGDGQIRPYGADLG